MQNSFQNFMNSPQGQYAASTPILPPSSNVMAAPSSAGAGTGAAIGSAVGMLGGPVGMILGSVAGAAVGGIFDAIQGSKNRKEMRRQQAEAREMAERQWSWGQQMDRFNMGMMNRQADEAEKMNNHQISQARIDRLNQVLQTSVGLQNHVRSLWGRR